MSKTPKRYVGHAVYSSKIDDARKEIKGITDGILRLFLKRQLASRKLARYKLVNGVAIENLEVEMRNIRRARNFAVRHGISEAYTVAIMKLIIEASKDEQNRELQFSR